MKKICWKRKWWLWLLLGAVAFAAGGPITFEEVASKAGVNFVSSSCPTPEKHHPEAFIGGVALLDYDGDGYLDIYFTNGASMPGLSKDDPRFKNRLYRNNHNMTFTDVTDQAGLGGTGYAAGVAVGDYDNDGWPDIFVANVNGNELYHNNGNGTFTNVTKKAGVAGALFEGRKMWSVSAAWVDYNNDGLLDLFVSNYCRWDPRTEKACYANGRNGLRVTCDPRYCLPLPATLYRNNGNGTFTDVSAETGISKHLGRGMGVAIADYDGDGYQDIFVADDNSPNHLFHNIHGKRFEEVGMDAGVALNDDGNVVSGMGVDFRDVLNNGLPSLWVTAIEKQTWPFYVNVGGGRFENRATMANLGDTFEMSGWSNAVADFDNDGWKDLFVARSNAESDIHKYSPRTYEEPNTIYRNLGNGRFQDVSAGAGVDVQAAGVHRGLAYGDLDNDGRLDMVIGQLNGPAKIFHNTTQNNNHWMLLKLTGTKSNRMAIGAKVRLTGADGLVQHNHVTTATGYASSSDSRVHFGLGASTAAKEIEITWPSGAKQVLHDVAGDRVVTITEP